MRTKRKIAINTGGGDAPGLNAVIRAATLAAIECGFEVWGIRHGYRGLLEPEADGLIRLDRERVRGIGHLGGTILGTVNRGDPFKYPTLVPGSTAPVPVDRADEMIERFKEENGVVFTVATLEYLQKGGRIGRAAALAGTLLNVKPILSVDDGVVHPIGKVRGRQKALAEFARVFTSTTEDRPGLRLAIAHAEAPEWIEVLTDLAARLMGYAS